MKDMLLTNDGHLVKSVKKVVVTDDGTVFSGHNEANIYEKLDVMIEVNGKNPFPNEIEFLGYKFKNSEIDGYDFELSYTNVSSEDVIVFKITKDNFILDDIYYWDRCSELTKSRNIQQVKKEISLFDILKNDYNQEDFQYFNY